MAFTLASALLLPSPDEHEDIHKALYDAVTASDPAKDAVGCLQLGAIPDRFKQDGCTALMFAAYEGKPAMLPLLLKAG